MPMSLASGRTRQPEAPAYATDLLRRQHPEVAADGLVPETLPRLVQIVEVATVAPSHRQPHRKFGSGISGPVHEKCDRARS